MAGLLVALLPSAVEAGTRVLPDSLAPQVWLVHEATGRWSWTGKRLGYTMTFPEHVGSERPTAAAERLTSGVRPEDAPAALDYAWRNPAGLARRAVVNLHLVDKYTLPGLLQSGGLVLVAVGLARLRWTRARREWVLAASLLPFGALLLLNVESRYVVPALPAIAIIAALGVVRLGRPRRARLPALGTVTLVLALLSFAPWLVRPWFREDPSGVDRTAGHWLRAEAGPGATFLGRYPVIGYYAGARDLPLGARSLEEALADGRRHGARFLVVDSVRTPEVRPDLLPLLGGVPVRPELALARTIEDRAGRRVLIYRILPGGSA